jgi:hypothetical protein
VTLEHGHNPCLLERFQRFSYIVAEHGDVAGLPLAVTVETEPLEHGR